MLIRRLAQSLRRRRSPQRVRFSRDARGAATIEFVLLFPAIASLLAVIVFGGEGFEIDRKLTMTVRTLADLASQQTDVGPAATYPCSSLLSAAALVIAPYSSSALSMTLSEIQVTASGSGKVVWSKTSNGTALTVGASVSTPANITSGYLILGQATYAYNPLQIYIQSNAITLSSSLYLSPRKASVGCTGC